MTAIDPLTIWAHRRPSIAQRFATWLDTPDGQRVYAECRDRSLTLRRRGWRHFSIDAIWHSVRFDAAVKVGPDADGYKLNNDFTSHMARHLMATEPELAGFFETRVLRA